MTPVISNRYYSPLIPGRIHITNLRMTPSYAPAFADSDDAYGRAITTDRLRRLVIDL